MTRISLIILTYNSSNYIEDLLSDLLQHFAKELKNEDLEIVVADNLSHDDTLKKIERYKDKVTVVNNKGNVGFAKGNNLAVKKAKGDFLLFMNPDARFRGGSIFDLIKVFDDKNIGILGGEIFTFSGKRELSCGKFYGPLNVILLAFGLEEVFGVRFAPRKEKKVDFVSGGFLMIRKSLFDRLNGFDENYFMYIEDSDLCYRAKKIGYTTLFSPLASIKHVGQGSSNRTFAVVNIFKGLIYFNKKKGMIPYHFVRFLLLLKSNVLVLIGKMMNNKYLTETYLAAKENI